MLIVGKVRCVNSMLKLATNRTHPQIFRLVPLLECKNCPLIRTLTNQSENVKPSADASSIFLDKHELGRSTEYIRNLLYPDTNDDTINRLKQCRKMDEVLRIIDTDGDSLTLQQLCEAVLVLRDMQKVNEVAFEFQIYPDGDYPANEVVTENPSFKKLIRLLENKVPEMNASEASCCVLYLRKLHLDTNEPLMRKLMNACEELTYGGNRMDVPVIDVARWFVVLRETQNIWCLYTMINYLPYVLYRMGKIGQFCRDPNRRSSIWSNLFFFFFCPSFQSSATMSRNFAILPFACRKWRRLSTAALWSSTNENAKCCFVKVIIL